MKHLRMTRKFDVMLINIAYERVNNDHSYIGQFLSNHEQLATSQRGPFLVGVGFVHSGCTL